MKRRDLVRQLIEQGCILVREGSRHSVFLNPKERVASTVPRHTEINDFLAKKICATSGFQRLRIALNRRRRDSELCERAAVMEPWCVRTGEQSNE